MTAKSNGGDREAIIRSYGAAALANIVANMTITREGHRNETLNKCAFAAGRLIGAGALEGREAMRALHAAALSTGLNEQEALGTISSGLEAGQKQPRNLDHIGNRSPADRSRRAPPASAPSSRAVQPGPKKRDVADQARVEGVIDKIMKRYKLIAGTPVEHYLATRGVDAKDTTGLLDLGFAAGQPYFEDGKLVGYYSTMIGIVRDCRTGAILSLHRTYLQDDGSAKADVGSPKKFLSSVKGGLVSLGNFVGGLEVGVAEGIESALSLRVGAGIPAAALLSSALFQHFVPGRATRAITIAADSDGAGLRASQELADRLRAVGIAVRIVIPPPPYNDINDVLRDGGRAAVRRLVEATPWLAPIADGTLTDRLGASKSAGHQEWLYDSTCIAAVEAKNIAWLWEPRIALGKITLLSGHPGQGKSQFTAHLAARTTRGEAFVDGQRCPCGSVIMVACEDDVADTVRPRLEAAGADLGKVHMLDLVRHKETGRLSEPHLFNLELGLEGLEAMVDEIGDVRLIVIDPISAYLGGADSHKNAEVRELLMPVQRLAAAKGIAVVMVTHLNKASGMDAMSRMTGSVAFVASARAAYLVHRDPADGARRLFLPVKNNIGAEGAGLSFTIEECNVGEGIKTSRVVMDSTPIEMTADEALAGSNSERSSGPSAIDDAKEWLESALEAGPRPVKEIIGEATGEKIAGRTLRRAKRELGVKAFRVGFGEGSYSAWKLPKPLDGS